MFLRLLIGLWMLLLLPVAAWATAEQCYVAYNKKTYAKAYNYCIDAARRDDLGAQVRVASLYQNGLGTKKDLEKAAYWYQEAANKGDVLSMRNTGIALMNGQGVKQDDAKALDWLIKANSLKDSVAYQHAARLCVENRAPASYCNTASTQWDISVMYRNDALGFPKDSAKEFLHARNAAQLGHVLAMGQVGFAYANGVGVNQNYGLAVDWYNEAIKHGNANAMNNLGVLYDKGLGVPRDAYMAATLYQQAADAGDAAGMFDLAWAYQYGNGLKRDVEQAKLWYGKAKAAGYQEAKNKLFEINQLEARSPEMFGLKLTDATRESFRKTMGKTKGKAIREDNAYYYDKYDAKALLEGSDELSLGFVNASGMFVEAEYSFPATLNPKGIEGVKNMVSSKYGEPKVVKLDEKAGGISYQWNVGVIEVNLRSEWPSGHVFLSLTHPTQKMLLDRELEVGKRKLEEKKFQLQFNAF